MYYVFLFAVLSEFLIQSPPVNPTMSPTISAETTEPYIDAAAMMNIPIDMGIEDDDEDDSPLNGDPMLPQAAPQMARPEMATAAPDQDQGWTKSHRLSHFALISF